MAALFFGSKLKKLTDENLVRCLICVNIVNEPCYLSCCRSVFCRDCLSSFSTYQKTSRRSCPLCVSPSLTSPVPGIPSDNRCKLLSNRAVFEGEWKSCKHCRNQKAVGHCISCPSVPVCKECIKQHKINGHLVVSSATQIFVKCTEKKHSANELQGFCENCDIPCCRECARKEHQGHKVVDIDSTIEKHLKAIKNLSDKLKREMEQTEHVIKQLKRAYDIKRSNMEKLMKNVSTYISSVIDKLKHSEKELKRSCEQICKTAENVMEQQVAYRTYNKRHIYRLMCLINEFSHPSQKFPLVLHFSHISRYADQFGQITSELSSDMLLPLTREHNFRASTFPECVGEFVEDSQPGNLPDLEHSCSGLSINHSYTDVSDKVLTKPIRLWSEFRLKDDGSSTGPHGACFASCGNETKCVVAQYNNSSLLLVNDFNVEQKFSEIKLRNFCPRSVVQIPSDALKFAVTDNFDTVVKIVNCSKDVHCVDPVEVFSINHRFTDPSGLVLLPNTNNFVVSDIHQRFIKCITSDGQLLWSVGDSSSHIQPIVADFITVDHQSRILLSDRRDNCIKILDYNGCYISNFGSDVGLVSPTGICVDCSNNILVADSNNHRILMFSSDGKFIQLLLKTDWPNGIALSNDEKYLTVTSKDGNLSMFKILK